MMSMPRAIWNDQVIAEAQESEVEHVEGNVYFPLSAVRREFLKPSYTHTTCPWKGIASYYNVVVNDIVNVDAAWYYPEPYEKAAHIRDHVAFWHGVTVED
jgi:uncharacterized protein (DUF427 family)